MPTPEEIQAQIDKMQKQIAEMEELKKQLALPLKAILHKVLFTGVGGIVEFKFNRPPQPSELDKLRTGFFRVPTRSYIASREVNAFNIQYYDQAIYWLKEHEFEIELPEKELEEVNLWKAAPDFKLDFDEKKKQIIISKTIKRTTLPYIYDMGTFSIHSSSDNYSFSLSELLKWMEMEANSFKHWRFDHSDKVKELYKEQFEREQMLDQFADMKDADIDFKFSYVDSNGVTQTYDLKPDQRVACKFDDTFNSRSLISFDMGKGKTAIAVAQAERHNERILFVCKASLKTNIKREIKKFTGKDAHVFTGINPDALDVDHLFVKKQQYNIISYSVIGREIKDKKDEPGVMKWVELINMAGFDRIVYDEAHYMKNMETQMSRGGRALKSHKVMLLTGTPIVNRPGEIFPVLNIIDPVTFYDYPTFLRQFTTDGVHPKNLPQLHKLLKRYMIRRLRDTSLDPNRIVQYHTLSTQAKKNYADVFAGLYVALRNPNYKSQVHHILTELLRCKQICADDKVDLTVDLAEEALDETEAYPWNKVIIFSQFKATQAEIARRLGPQAKIINGDVTDKNRYDIIDQFQDEAFSDPKLRVIVTNITEGITLTQAGTVIINDLWWTPKDHLQAEGRAFGRTNDPHGGNAYYVLAEQTIEEDIWRLLEKKMRIAKQIVDDVYVKADGEDEQESLLSELMRNLRGE